MSSFDDLLAKSKLKSGAVPKGPRKTLGLKETMRSIKQKSEVQKKIYESTLEKSEVSPNQSTVNSINSAPQEKVAQYKTGYVDLKTINNISSTPEHRSEAPIKATESFPTNLHRTIESNEFADSSKDYEAIPKTSGPTNISVANAEQFRSNSVACSNPDKSHIRSNSVADAEHIRSKSSSVREIILGLSNLQLSVLGYVFQNCQMIGSIRTEPIKNETIARLMNTTPETVRNTLNRIISVGILIRVASKRGRGGWAIYEIDSKDFIGMKSVLESIIPEQMRSNSVAQSVAQSVANPPSKLVSNINNNLLTSEKTTDKLVTSLGMSEPQPEFMQANIEPLRKFGISQKQLGDFKNQKLNLSLEQLNTFIERFAIYASDSKNVGGVGSKVGLFCKMAQTLSKEQIDPLEGTVKTPEEMIIEKQLELAKKALLEKQKRREELSNIRFEEWYLGLSKSERDEYATPNDFAPSGSELQKKVLRAFYIENIFQEN